MELVEILFTTLGKPLLVQLKQMSVASATAGALGSSVFVAEPDDAVSSPGAGCSDLILALCSGGTKHYKR